MTDTCIKSSELRKMLDGLKSGKVFVTIGESDRIARVLDFYKKDGNVFIRIGL